MKNWSNAASSDSSSRSSWIVHRCSTEELSRKRCSVPSRKRIASVLNCNILFAGYCATAPVLSVGNMASEVRHYVIDGVHIQHRLPDLLRDVVAMIEKRLAVH